MKELLKKTLRSLGYVLQSTRYIPKQLLAAENLRALDFDDVICRHMFESSKSLTFLQIGVYDGITHDPLRKYIVDCGWRGLMVEPQRKAAQCLNELYHENTQVKIINAALDRQAGERTLFTVHGEDAPSWAGGLASFDRATIAKHVDLVPGLEQWIREERVACVTFGDILEQLPGPNLDILQIDTEGADGFILSLFPFKRLKPTIVHYEIKHLNILAQENALELLVGHGYRVARSGAEDMLAVLNGGQP